MWEKHPYDFCVCFAVFIIIKIGETYIDEINRENHNCLNVWKNTTVSAKCNNNYVLEWRKSRVTVSGWLSG